MITRLLPRLLLILALLTGQQLAFGHAVGHVFEGRPAPAQRDGQLVDKACEQCLAQAQLFGAASTQALLPAVPPAARSALADSVIVWLPPVLAAYGARAPPVS